MKILCTICGRGGSKGLINKNIKSFLGKPLVSYTIKQAIKSKLFYKIALSSDSKKILKIGKKLGVDFTLKRPERLSRDLVPKTKVIKNLLFETEKAFKINFDLIVDLDITSPLRTIGDIKNSINLIKNKKKSCSSCCVAPARRNPYFNMVEMKKNKLMLSKKWKKNIIARQDAPKVFDLNASVFAWHRLGLIKSVKIINKDTCFFIVPPHRGFDIDSKIDFDIAEYLYKLKK